MNKQTEATSQNLHQITGNVADINTVPIERSELRRLHTENNGVGESIKPPVQPDTAPAAWAIFSKDGTAMVMWSRDIPSAKNTAEKLGLPLVPLYTAPQPTENLRCKSTQKRLATLWGYVKQEPARQPLTDEQIIKIADKTQTAEPGTDGYILPISFARAIEAFHNITGGQQ